MAVSGQDRRRVFVIGLDSAAPALVFDELRDSLPNLSRLMADGVWGPLRSCVPAITVPSWMTGYTGKDPGELGIYGFRNRSDHSYTGLAIADSSKVAEPTAERLGARARPAIASFASWCAMNSAPPTLTRPRSW